MRIGGWQSGIHDPAPYREWGLVFGVLFQFRDDLVDRGESPELLRLKAEYERKLSALDISFRFAV